MDIKEVGIDNIGLSVRAFHALQGQNVTTVGQLLEYTEERLYHIRNLGAKTVGEILKKIDEYRKYAEKNELPASMPDQDADSMQDEVPLSALISERNVDCITIEEIRLPIRAIHALHFNGVYTLGQLLEYNEEKLHQIRNLGAKTIDEILKAIEECQEYLTKNVLPQTPEELIAAPEGNAFIVNHLKEKQTGIDALKLLSARAFNLLTFHGYAMLYQILFMDEDGLMLIPRMDKASAAEIRMLCDEYLMKNGEALLEAFLMEKTKVTIHDMVSMPEYHERILRFSKENDRTVDTMGLSSRPTNQLLKNGYRKLSEILFLNKADLLGFQGMGANSADEILQCIHDYLSANEQRLMAYCAGDESILLDDETIRRRILELYTKIGFAGLNLDETIERLNLPAEITVDRIKQIIGGLLAANELEYVDYRCYRVYPKFRETLMYCEDIDEREARVLQNRLDNMTLEAIGQAEGELSRERIRQIIIKAVRKVFLWHKQVTHLEYFDEDYYRYLYSTYQFDRASAAAWLGIPDEVFSFFDMQDIRPGKKPLEDALSDHLIDAGLRLKIKNYINRNRLLVDGTWVEKKRANLEMVVARKYCTDEIPYSKYVELYNAFLQQNEIPYNDRIYYTPDVIATRKNRLTDARFVLWKQGEMLRYYDIDGQDYSELFAVLGLGDYENIEISTLKLMDLYPETMEKYDIRDQYELHNLLKKVTDLSAYPGIQFGRMPMITFGNADRSSQMLELIIDHAPLTFEELQQYARDEYGFEPGAIIWKDIVDYYHDGVFTVDQKVMPADRKAALLAALTDDFYYFHEIKRLYSQLIPDADLEEINPYNLRQMGFIVLSKYAVQHHPSLEAYFIHMLTTDDLVDISSTRKRFSYLQAFSQTLSSLKRDLQIVEYEPNQFINIRQLEKSGVTKASIQAFCDAVWEYVPDGAYFSAASLRQDGFESELYDLGFSDWFYGSLLSADGRFSFCTAFGTIMLFKGKTYVSIKAFESSLIRQAEQIDAYDLQTEMTEHYGCRITDKSDLIYKVRETEIYYDRILDRFYANEAAFERDLDRTEEL